MAYVKATFKGVKFSAKEQDELEGQHLLPNHESKRTIVTHQRKYITPLTLAVALAIGFLGGFATCRWDKAAIMRDPFNIVPGPIDQLVRQSVAGRSFPHFTSTPFVRDEDPDIEQHPWRHEPSSENDDYFESNFGHGMIFLISADDMRRMGKDPEQYAHIGEDWGYGDKIYPTRFDHTHQMHCLHVLQSMLYPEHYKITVNQSWPAINPLERSHGEHCLWALHDYLSCHGSYEVYNYKWFEGIGRPVPDHASMRGCRDMSPMPNFYEKHNVATDARLRFLVPQEGDYIHAMSPQRLAAYNAKVEASAALWKLEDWTRERSKHFEKAMAEWRETGRIPYHHM